METTDQFSTPPPRRNLNFRTPGYEDLELSTQILIGEALRRGAAVEVLDRQESFISIERRGRREYVKQATRTSLDTYIAPLLMENKLVTKHVLARERIAVPEGMAYGGKTAALTDRGRYAGREIVIKPKSTNFGLGVAILGKNHTAGEYEQALETAFSLDCTVLIEEFIDGREFRYLILGDQVNAILHRVPANVAGDGISTIRELVERKNLDPLRGKGYTTPLEKISLAATEAEYLAGQGKSFETVPAAGETVYLRRNSNISTGGDSIDFTDRIHPAYKQLALKATRAAGAVICGADIIIQDIDQPPVPGNHAVIELNFNPAIHIHCFPYLGRNRHPEQVLLDMLGFI